MSDKHKKNNKKKQDNGDQNEKKESSNTVADDKLSDEKNSSVELDSQDVKEDTSESSEDNAESTVSSAEKSKNFISDISNSVSALITNVGLAEMSLIRIIAAFFIISATNISSIREKTVDGININPVSMWKDFIPLVNIPLTIILMVSVYLLMSLLFYILPKSYRITDQLFAIASILYFDIILLWKSNDFNLSFGVMMVSVVFICYCFSKIKDYKLINKMPWWISGIVVLICAVAVAAFISVTTIMTHKTFGTACHDFGLFVQMFHSLIDNGTAITSCERDTIMSHFKIHASYIFYVLVPIFKMFPKPETLLISQAVLAMGGVIPMFLIAKRHNFKNISLMFMGLAYVFCTGIIGPCYYEFHENAFLPTILMWLLWAVDRKNYIMFYIMSIITCLVKEDAPLYVISIGLYLFFENKGNIRRLNGIIMALVAGCYMIFITNWLTKNGDGQMMMDSRFSILMIDTSAGLKEVVKNAFSDPAYLFSLLIKDDTTRFFLQVMVPLLFLPFFTTKIHRFLLMVPFIVMNLIIGAGYGYAANIGFQYIFGPACLLLYMCIINIDDMGQHTKQNLAVALGSAAIILTIGTYSYKINNVKYYNNDKEYFDALETMLDSIPKDASVGTDSYLIPHITDHKEIYIFDSEDYIIGGGINNPERYDFIVLSMRADYTEDAKNAINNNGFLLWSEIPGKYQIYMNPSYTG